jgi:hypothetical protein
MSLTPWPFYPLGKTPRYPLDRRLGGPLPGLEFQLLGHPANSQLLYQVAYPTSLMYYKYSHKFCIKYQLVTNM